MPGTKYKYRIAAVAALMVAMSLEACGDDESSPMAPAAGWDQITVTLDYIDVYRACDGGATGEVQYMFYVTRTVDGADTTYLDTDWKSITSADGTLWDNIGRSATFELARRSGAEFSVRMRLRELDTAPDFEQGILVRHNSTRSTSQLWQPDSGGYSSYDAPTRTGAFTWDVNERSDCHLEMGYVVEIEPLNPK